MITYNCHKQQTDKVLRTKFLHFSKKTNFTIKHYFTWHQKELQLQVRPSL